MFDNTQDDPHPQVVEGMMAFTVAGFTVFPLAANKRPGVPEWGPLRTTPPDLAQIEAWGSRRYDGYAVICGGPQRLLMIDFEAGFIATSFDAFVARLRDAGLYDVFAAWLDGYCVETPSGGLHVAVRLGDGIDMPGNQKLAMAAPTEVLVETRAEGGYVVGPGSGGRCHPSGGRWIQRYGGPESIGYAIPDEWRGIESVLENFDRVPPAPARTVATRSTVTLDPMLRGDSWIDEIKAALPSIEALLLGRGWQWTGSADQFGRHLTRPGKDPREGGSANLSTDGYLWVHSTNAGLPTGVGLDATDILICWETGQRHAPTLDQRTEYLQRHLQAQAPPAEVGPGAAPIANEVADLNLPPDFWEARPYLTHIHQAALSLRLSPDAVWAGIKCFYAATIPWNHRLPGDGTLDYISIVVGSSGAGKSRAKHAAYLLLENCRHIDGVYFPVPAGSGEGLTEFYLDRTDNDRRYKARGVGFYADEGRFLLDISSRPGNTTMQAVKQMWSGELTGSVAATSDRHRWLDPRDVRGTLLISTTPEVAAEFMSRDYTDEGLPQRIAWAWAHYPHPDTKPDWPGPLDIQAWDYNRTGDNIYHIDIAPDLLAAIDQRQLAAARGQQTDGLEGHATYAILKTAGIHAHLDHRMNINDEDWALAAQDWETTGNIRRHVQTAYQQHVKERTTAAGQARAHQRIAETDVYLERAILSLVRKLKNSKEPLNKDQIRTHLASYRKRHQISHHEIIDAATARGQVTLTPHGYTTDL